MHKRIEQKHLYEIVLHLMHGAPPPTHTYTLIKKTKLNLKRHRKSGHFDTSGSLIALFVSEISPSGFFVTSTEEGGGGGIAYSSSWMTLLFGGRSENVDNFETRKEIT